jgi:acyl-CoA synthetase (AMP-forming)/AMP-acid ligase II
LIGRHPQASVIADDRVGELSGAAGLSSYTPISWLAATHQPIGGGDGGAVSENGQPAVVIYTSGSTSAPKGVLIRHDNLVSYVLGSVEFGGAAADEASLVCVPPYHIAAVANCITNLYAGRRTVIAEQFIAKEWLETVRSEEITHGLVVPTMLAKLMELEDEQLAAPSLRAVAYGGAPIPRRVIERALAVWPDVGFVTARRSPAPIPRCGLACHRSVLRCRR